LGSSEVPENKETTDKSARRRGTRHSDDDEEDISTILKQLKAITSYMKESTTANKKTLNTIESLVMQVANVQMQLTQVKSENASFSGRLDLLNKRITEIEIKQATPPKATPESYASIAQRGLPPRPNP